MSLNGDEAADDTARYQGFMVLERAAFAAAQEQRRQRLEQRITLEEIEEAVAEQEELPTEEPDDPWLLLLKGLETRTGVVKHYTSDGDTELRVSTKFLLVSVLGLPPDRGAFYLAAQRLGRCMRQINWEGPLNLRIRTSPHHSFKTKGYRKVIPRNQDE